MELSSTLNLTTPAPIEFFASSFPTPTDLKAELTGDEYVAFCAAARTKGGFADKWFELTPAEATSLVAPPCATPPPPLEASSPPPAPSDPRASEAPVSVDGARRA